MSLRIVVSVEPQKAGGRLYAMAFAFERQVGDRHATAW